MREKLFLSGGVESCRKTVEQWRNIVERYTLGNLTNGEDKLVAIAGVAKVAYEGNGYEYLAGMWKPWLNELIGWEPKRILPKPRSYRAPSWSWAAVDGPIRFRTPCYPDQNEPSRLAHVLEASVVPVTTDPFGQIVSGVLTLSCCQLVSGTFYLGDGWVSSFEIAGQKLGLHVDFDYLYSPDTGEVDAVLLVLYGRVSLSYGMFGLVLQASESVQGKYHRIGSFLTWNDCPPCYDLFNCFTGTAPPLKVLNELREKMPELAIRSDDTTFPGAPFVIEII